MKKILCVLMCMVCVIGLTACSGGSGSGQSNDSGKVPESSEAGGQSGGKDIVLGFADMATDEMGAIYQGLFESYAGEAGVQSVVFASDADVAKQISQIEDLITRDVDVIYIRPVDNKGIEMALSECAQAGIPVVLEPYDENVENVEVFVESMDNYGFGKAQADDLIQKLEADPELTVNVGYLWGMKGLVAAQDRNAGFMETIEPYVSKGRVNIIDEKSMEGDISKLQGIVEDWLVSHPEIDTYICANDAMALSVTSVLDAANKSYDGIYIYGMDGEKAAMELIKQGKMTATVVRDLDTQAKKVIDVMCKVAEGEKLEKVIDFELPVVVINKDNVGEYLSES